MEMKNNQKLIRTGYYDMQETQDKLYAESMSGKSFDNLMDIIISPQNIMLAYRTIKRNDGSQTPGTDKKTIAHFADMAEDEFIYLIQSKFNNYHAKMVKRVNIPKPGGKVRPLGIPCMIDRIIQQCILQVLEPICEAKFSDQSFGFRPNRSAKNAIAECERLMQRVHTTYVVDIDIKSFFDNVNHRKLIRQIWTMGIHDAKLLQVIKEILNAPILMPDETVEHPKKGTPQGGILSPLLANIVLNEFDHWIESQWKNQYKYMKKPNKPRFNNIGTQNLNHEYEQLRKRSNLKEVYVVRYADDIKIFCKTKDEAERIYLAAIDWLGYRLKLDVSKEKSGITNLKNKYTEFLGFRLKLRKKSGKYVVRARMSQKAFESAHQNLLNQIKRMQSPKNDDELKEMAHAYNAMVMGIQNYYGIANCVTIDLCRLQYLLLKPMEHRLVLSKEGKITIKILKERYGSSEQVRYINGYPIVPIGYYKSRTPLSKKKNINQYTPEGREEWLKSSCAIHNVALNIMKNPIRGGTVEYNDNRISLFYGQRGKCGISGRELCIGNMQCHHKIPKSLGGTDEYNNLIWLEKDIHILIHATDSDTIQKYLKNVAPTKRQLQKINDLRVLAGNALINI